MNHLWVVEMLGDIDLIWRPQMDCSTTNVLRSEARKSKKDLEDMFPSHAFRIRKYVSVGDFKKKNNRDTGF